MQHNPSDIIKVSTDSVACDGGKGVLGHPRIFLDLKKKGFVTCPYCSQQFELEK